MFLYSILNVLRFIIQYSKTNKQKIDFPLPSSITRTTVYCIKNLLPYVDKAKIPISTVLFNWWNLVIYNNGLLNIYYQIKNKYYDSTYLLQIPMILLKYNKKCSWIYIWIKLLIINKFAIRLLIKYLLLSFTWPIAVALKIHTYILRHIYICNLQWVWNAVL